ncbi:MAG: hypothetical protein IKK84_03640 [Clostridia bacterium]|nr:hypothetical protein [Clostridia bacterium]
MNFILLDVKTQSKYIIEKEYKILETNFVKEIILSKEKLNKIANLKTKLKQNILDKIKVKSFENKINKALGRNKALYILANDINVTDKHINYLKELLSKLEIVKLIPPNEMDVNFTKYIEEYVVKNKLVKENIKMLFVYKEIANIDFNVIKAAVNEYKKVNIYIKESITKDIIDRIDSINDTEGTAIEIIKYNKKAFIDYDVVYYVDDYKSNYPRMRLNKKACVIDVETAFTDKFNTNIILFNKIRNEITEIDYLRERYGLLPIACVLKYITLDKHYDIG